MAFSHESHREGVAGAGGMGKTHRLASIVGEIKPQFVFGFDPKGQLAELFAVPWVRRWEQCGSAMRQTGFCFYEGRDGHGTGTPDLPKAFDAFCQSVFDVCERLPGTKLLMMEEVQEFANPHFMPPNLWRIIDTGRHPRIDFAYTCQFFNRINPSLRAQTTHVSAFNHTEGRTADFLLENGFRLPDLAGLGRGQYLWRRLKPQGPISARDDVRGINKMLPGQEIGLSPHLAKIFGKGAKATR